MALSRPVREKKQAAIFTPSKIPTPRSSVFKTHDYSLDTNKAMQKKLVACDRTDCIVSMEEECFVLKLSTAAYEFFKIALYEHYSSSRTVHDVVIVTEIRTDKNGINTDDSISVKPGPSSKAKRQLYHINLYHTTCTVTVNGQKRAQFRDEMEYILDILSKRGDYTAMNDYIRVKCTEYLSATKPRLRKQKNASISDPGSDDVPTPPFPHAIASPHHAMVACSGSGTSACDSNHSLTCSPVSNIHASTPVVCTSNATSHQTTRVPCSPVVTTHANSIVSSPVVTTLADNKLVTCNPTPDVGNQVPDYPCLVCHKNCGQDSEMCEICQGWIHYNCYQLSEATIAGLESYAPFCCYTCAGSISSVSGKEREQVSTTHLNVHVHAGSVREQVSTTHQTARVRGGSECEQVPYTHVNARVLAGSEHEQDSTTHLTARVLGGSEREQVSYTHVNARVLAGSEREKDSTTHLTARVLAGREREQDSTSLVNSHVLAGREREQDSTTHVIQHHTLIHELELQKSRTLLEDRDKQLKTREKSVKQKETALRKQEDQMHEQREQLTVLRDLMSKLEARMNTVTDENNLLKIKLQATPTEHPTAGAHGQPPNSAPNPPSGGGGPFVDHHPQHCWHPPHHVYGAHYGAQVPPPQMYVHQQPPDTQHSASLAILSGAVAQLTGSLTSIAMYMVSRNDVPTVMHKCQAVPTSVNHHVTHPYVHQRQTREPDSGYLRREQRNPTSHDSYNCWLKRETPNGPKRFFYDSRIPQPWNTPRTESREAMPSKQSSDLNRASTDRQATSRVDCIYGAKTDHVPTDAGTPTATDQIDLTHHIGGSILDPEKAVLQNLLDSANTNAALDQRTTSGIQDLVDMEPQRKEVTADATTRLNGQQDNGCQSFLEISSPSKSHL
jgi:hypothetical protein